MDNVHNIKKNAIQIIYVQNSENTCPFISHVFITAPYLIHSCDPESEERTFTKRTLQLSIQILSNR